jgi:hypothetical protein
MGQGTFDDFEAGSKVDTPDMADKRESLTDVLSIARESKNLNGPLIESLHLLHAVRMVVCAKDFLL